MHSRPVCTKCQENLANFKARAEFVCSHCMVVGVGTRVRRACFGSPTTGREVMLAFSGGHTSRAVLDILSQACDVGRRKRRFKQLAAVHVDTSALAGLQKRAAMTEEVTARQMQEVMEAACASHVSLVVVPLEALFMEGSSVAEGAAEGMALAKAAFDIRVPGLPKMGTAQADRVSERKKKREKQAEESVASGSTAAAVAAAAESEGAVAVQAEEPAGTPASAAASSSSPSPLASTVSAALEQWRALSSTPAFLSARQRMNDYFSGFSSIDGQQDQLQQLTLRAAVEAAQRYSFRILIHSSSTDRLAHQLMTSVCVGRGISLPVDAAPADLRFLSLLAGVGGAGSTEDAGAAGGMASLSIAEEQVIAASSRAPAPSSLSLPWQWYEAALMEPETAEPPAGSVTVLRPCLEVEARELVAYCRARKLQGIVSRPNFCSRTQQRQSISRAVEALLCELQSSFINTVHNVVRTARKLQTPAGVPQLSAVMPTIIPAPSTSSSAAGVGGKAAGGGSAAAAGAGAGRKEEGAGSVAVAVSADSSSPSPSSLLGLHIASHLCVLCSSVIAAAGQRGQVPHHLRHQEHLFSLFCMGCVGSFIDSSFLPQQQGSAEGASAAGAAAASSTTSPAGSAVVTTAQRDLQPGDRLKAALPLLPRAAVQELGRRVAAAGARGDSGVESGEGARGSWTAAGAAPGPGKLVSEADMLAEIGEWLLQEE